VAFVILGRGIYYYSEYLGGRGYSLKFWVGCATGTLEPYHLAAFFDPVLDLALELPALSVISLEIEHTESWDSLGC